MTYTDEIAFLSRVKMDCELMWDLNIINLIVKSYIYCKINVFTIFTAY